MMTGFEDQPVFERVPSLTQTERARVLELLKKGWPNGELTTAERIELQELKLRLEA